MNIQKIKHIYWITWPNLQSLCDRHRVRLVSLLSRAQVP